MMEFLAVVAAWLVVNVAVTRRVQAASRELHVPARLLIVTIWLLPFVGAFMAFFNTPSRAAVARAVAEATPRDRRGELGPPPQWLTHRATGTPFALDEHLAWADGLPVIAAPALAQWAAGEGTAPVSEAQRVQALVAGRRAWLQHLAQALGPQMGLRETADALVLSSLNPREEGQMADYVRTARHRVAKLLGDLADFPAGEPTIVLVLDDEATYYRYVSIYFPDGEFAASGGMFIDAGCPHFVVVRGHLGDVEPVIAHELTHAALAHLRLPRWLDEGIAVNSERRVAGVRPQLYTPLELHAMHRAHWTADKVQALWSGEGFLRADDSLLSYDLARILVEQLAGTWDAFAGFLRAAAGAQDGGAEAARAALGLDLGACAAALVEAPDDAGWSPDPLRWPGRGGLQAAG
jgi:hypothetical protein